MRRLITGLTVGILAVGLIAGPATARGAIASYTVDAICYLKSGEVVWTDSVTVLTKAEVKQATINFKADCQPGSIRPGDKAVVDVTKNPATVPL